MRVTVGSTADGCEGSLLEVDVKEGTTVKEFRQVLAQPPHSLCVTDSTKVLCRHEGRLMTLWDNEKVQNHVTLLNVNFDKKLAFPDKFVWGSATASYQIEGAISEGGRTPSIWDTFTAIPKTVKDGKSGEVACDHYHRFKEDVRLMKEMGLHAYRFSISWSRLLPAGRGKFNSAAVGFYRALLEELHAADITPWVTIYHWDLPQCLETEYNGWLSPKIVPDFEHYAKTCFELFGDRVKHWITLNEPWCACILGYATGEHAPGYSRAPGTDPYLVAHHMLLAHATAAACYRSRFQASQQGAIGITLNMDWKEPRTDSEADLKAQRRALDWQLGWFAEPLYKGQYPETMRRRCQGRLPTFTESERELLQGSVDFFGLNHYSTDYVENVEPQEPDSKQPESSSWFSDREVKDLGDPRWLKTGMGWDVVPWGFCRLLKWITQEYSPPGGIYVTENGCGFHEDDAAAARQDTLRVEYLQGYLTQLHKALQEGADVRGYFVWSLLDNFEWQWGYLQRLGIVRVDFETQKRTRKASSEMFSELAVENSLRVPLRVFESSSFTPYNTRAHKTTIDAEANTGKLEKPALSIEDAKAMLLELGNKYADDLFQKRMIHAYEQHLINGDDVALLKAKRVLCMPIQVNVFSKYGFEPTPRGVSQARSLLKSTEFKQDRELAGLSAWVVHLTDEQPKTVAVESANA